MENQSSEFELFSDSARKMITFIDANKLSSLEDLIRAQEATDKSHKLHAVLESWSNQQSEERKLRKLYAICFSVILGIQIVIMNVTFVLIGCKILTITEVQFNAFFISMFGEIAALVLVVTKYLFRQESDSKLIDTLKDL